MLQLQIHTGIHAGISCILSGICLHGVASAFAFTTTVKVEILMTTLLQIPYQTTQL